MRSITGIIMKLLASVVIMLLNYSDENNDQTDGRTNREHNAFVRLAAEA